MDGVRKNRFILLMAIGWLMCWISDAWSGDQLLVFAGNGLRKPLTILGKQLNEKYGFQVTTLFDGSKTLAKRIMLGNQMPDVFMPDAKYWAEELKRIGTVTQYYVIANHTPIIIAPIDNDRVHHLSDFIRLDVRVALADPLETSIGRIAQEIFREAGLSLDFIDRAAIGDSVKQVVRWVEMGNADAAIVWQEDVAFSDKVRRVKIPPKYNKPDIIPACMMKGTKKQMMAKWYIEYLLGEGKQVFVDEGFYVFQYSGVPEQSGKTNTNPSVPSSGN